MNRQQGERIAVPITADETYDDALMARLREYEDECVAAAAETIRSRGQIVNPMTVEHVCRIAVRHALGRYRRKS